MSKNRDVEIIESILGDDFFQELSKSEISGGLYKPETNTALDPEEIRIALKIVPRAVLSFLITNLKHKEKGEVTKLDLPFALNATLEAHKLGSDNYSGEIVKDGKRCCTFKHRSLPGIGLLILSTFELYDISDLDKKPEPEMDAAHKIQTMIDQRLQLMKLIQDVVDKRITERAAIDRLIKEKLTEHVLSVQEQDSEKEEEVEKEGPVMTKKSKLKEFLDAREKKRQESVDMDKSEIHCPDCDSLLYKNEDKNEIKLCICYGDSMNKAIKFSKAEDGKVNFKFPKSFDIENIEMLLDAIKKR